MLKRLETDTLSIAFVGDISRGKSELILSDIEMPHMDGFDLARAVRADPRNADIPFIVISSRVGDKHRDIAQSLGVNHYLGKPYSEPALLALVRTYFPEKALA